MGLELHFFDFAQAVRGFANWLYACSVRCKRVVEVSGKVDPFYGGPEYETAASFGSYCGVDSLAAVSVANQLCNMYGLDTIS